MLSFVMVTRNEGRALDDTLQGLQAVMEPADHLVAIDVGSTDRTANRLMEFAERASCTIIRLDAEKVSLAEALMLALGADQSDYVMWLGPCDHLRPQALSELRQSLRSASPDVAIVNSGWWFATPDLVWPRADEPRAAALPQDAAAAALLALCPDPRRLVIARAAQTRLRPLLAEARSDPALYTALVSAAPHLVFLSAVVVLHPHDTVDPATHLKALAQHLPADDASALPMITVWSDDAVLRTAPELAQALCSELHAVWRATPKSLQDMLKAHTGPSGALFSALDQSGLQDAMVHFALSALARQQQQTVHLAAAYAHLQQSVRAALPGPDYLQRLYDRARNI